MKKKSWFKLRAISIVLLSVFLLAACGGGGSGSSASPTVSNPTETTADTSTETDADEVINTDIIISDVTYQAIDIEQRLFVEIESSTLTSNANQINNLLADDIARLADTLDISEHKILLKESDNTPTDEPFETALAKTETLSGHVAIYLDGVPTNNNVLAPALAYQMYKAKRATLVNTESQMRDVIMQEALALDFAASFSNVEVSSLFDNVNPNELQSALDIINPLLDVETFLVEDLLLGQGEVTTAATYATGLAALNRYQQQFPGSNSTNLISISADAFSPFYQDEKIAEQKRVDEISNRSEQLPSQRDNLEIALQGQKFKGIAFVEGWNKRNLIAMTFDDGPTQAYTTQILDILKENNVKATFFWLGQNMQNNQDIARRTIEEGHSVANHSWDHPHGATLSNELLWQQQVQRTNDLMEQQLGYQTRFYRPPYGEITDEQIEYLESKGVKTILWSLITHDWYTQAFYEGYPARDAQSIAAQSINNQHQEMIVVNHDGGGDRQATVDSLQETIDHFKAEGYQFVTMETLLGVGEKF